LIEVSNGREAMAKGTIKEESVKFLKTLKKNNNRDWFNAHKDLYLKAHENIIEFADALLNEMNKHDKIETPTGKRSLFRIYRDVRFSKDKTPYSDHWSGGFKRATSKLRGGYYFHIAPGNCYLAGGFWGPESDDLKRIRQDIDMCHDEWRKMLKDKTLVKTFGGIMGDQVSSAPRGYDKKHPAIDLLRYKQFILRYKFTDKEVLSPDFAKKVSDVFKKMRPFLNYMSEVLTTDANGEPII
jgi:uncharacterized protein (TIGR02453 family)